MINEVLYDPPAGDNVGDANGDGSRDPNEDEFIEFYNSGLEIDISGYTITDNRPADGEQLRHTFPEGSIIPANGVLVLFGGGNPSGDFGNSIVQTASEGLINMNNDGDFITMYDNCGDVILTFDVEPLSNNPNESYTLSPDITGETFEQHAGIPGSNGALFSPGYKLDGTDF
ncbi:lamin tail domain-containing protein [Flavobacteriaceae bacterium]|nr:lamin tail domain-containing protein [Flavobacteriaceae bacterium]